MHIYKFNKAIFIIALFLLTSCQTARQEQWIPLLDSNLSQWEIWMGVPHTSVIGLPSGTFQTHNVSVHGDTKHALGLNNDVKEVFKVTYENDQPVLHISGEIYGGLTTLSKYQNYHLSLMVKWGEQKWAPRLTKKRDSGVLFHCRGPHGAFWKTWKACQELQIQEKDFGDFIPLAGPTAKVLMRDKTGERKYAPDGKFYRKVSNYTHASIEPDLPHGEWNKVELFVFKDRAIFIVNDTVVMKISESKDKDGKVLDSGQIQLQSEGAEVFFKEVKIRSIKSLPKSLE